MQRDTHEGDYSIVQGVAGNCNGTLSEAPCLNNHAKEENLVQVDLRVHGVSQDEIYKDVERMAEMQLLVDRLQEGHRDQSIIMYLKHEGVSNVRIWRNNHNNSVSYVLSTFQ